MSAAVRVAVEVRVPLELAVLLDHPVPGSLGDRVQWLERVVAWVRRPEPGLSLPSRHAPTTLRLRTLVRALEADADRRGRVRATVASVLGSTSAVALLADVGTDRDRGLWTAFAGRFTQRVFPHAAQDDDLRPILRRVFGGDAAAEWLEGISEPLLARLHALLDPDGSSFRPVHAAKREAVALLGAQASSLGLSVTTVHGGGLRDSPFWELPRVCESWLAARSPAELDPARARLLATLRHCREQLEAGSARIQAGPVETGLVLRGHVLRDALSRIEDLTTTPGSVRESRRLWATLIQAQARYQEMGSLWTKAWRPLSRRIVEHTGNVGEHYLTRSPAQWHQMVAAAAGGGAITVVTATAKLMIAAAGLSLFFSGLASSANYALSFLLIQLCGFALATKQPSMTAAAVAAAIDVQTPDGTLRKLSREVAVVFRSQVASVLGNLGVVVPGAVLVQWLSMRAGHPLVDLEQARYVAASIDPLHGAMIPFALLTGVLLWLSSVGGGWVENWARCHRVPHALARHRGLTLLLGPARAARFAVWIDHHLCGIGSNLALGLLLGMVPAVAQFFGLGLEVRHVTLSAGSLGLAGAALGAEGVLQPQFLRAVAGIGVIAVANLGISFGLSLGMALRARGIQPGRRALLRALLDGAGMAVRNRAPAYVRLVTRAPPSAPAPRPLPLARGPEFQAGWPGSGKAAPFAPQSPP